MPAEEALRLSEAEGLTLVRSTKAARSGFKGVSLAPRSANGERPWGAVMDAMSATIRAVTLRAY